MLLKSVIKSINTLPKTAADFLAFYGCVMQGISHHSQKRITNYQGKISLPTKNLLYQTALLCFLVGWLDSLLGFMAYQPL